MIKYDVVIQYPVIFGSQIWCRCMLFILDINFFNSLTVSHQLLVLDSYVFLDMPLCLTFFLSWFIDCGSCTIFCSWDWKYFKIHGEFMDFFSIRKAKTSSTWILTKVLSRNIRLCKQGLSSTFLLTENLQARLWFATSLLVLFHFLSLFTCCWTCELHVYTNKFLISWSRPTTNKTLNFPGPKTSDQSDPFTRYLFYPKVSTLYTKIHPHRDPNTPYHYNILIWQKKSIKKGWKLEESRLESPNLC